MPSSASRGGGPSSASNENDRRSSALPDGTVSSALTANRAASPISPWTEPLKAMAPSLLTRSMLRDSSPFERTAVAVPGRSPRGVATCAALAYRMTEGERPGCRLTATWPLSPMALIPAARAHPSSMSA